MTISKRRQQILKAVIDDYILTSEPVGSKRLVDQYDLGVSSATVRSEMSQLEDMGYLSQPHTSAGRIPSDLGYREYVDNLMEVEELKPEEQKRIRQTLELHSSELMETLRTVAMILSRQSGYASVAVSPRTRNTLLEQIKMLVIEPGKVLVVVVLSQGVVKDRVVRLPDVLTNEMMNQIALTLEQNVSGYHLDDITLVTLQTATDDIELPDSLLNQVLYEAYVSIKQADHMDTYIEGVPNLFQHPEFREATRAYHVVDALTTEGFIAGFLNNPLSAESVAYKEIDVAESGGFTTRDLAPAGRANDFLIRIGQELQVQGLEECSFVTTSYHLGDDLHGRIAVVGPKRMHYEKVVSEIRFVRKTIHQLDQKDETR